MPKIRITKSVVPTLAWSGKQTRYFDTKTTGFGVIVNEKSASYFVQAKAGEREFVHTIGRTDILRYDNALEIARDVLEDAARGITPKDRRRAVETAARKTAALESSRDFTLRTAYAEYLAARPKLKPGTLEKYDDAVNDLADWMDIPLRSITKQMVLARYAELRESSPSMANNAFRMFRAVVNLAMLIHDDALPINPVAILSATKSWHNIPARRGYLRPENLRTWFDLAEHAGEPNVRVALKMLLFTGARRMEIFTLKWKDLELEHGTMYVSETKTGEPLNIPICSYLVGLLKEHAEYFKSSDDGFVFPSTRSKSGHLVDCRWALETMASKGAANLILHDLRRTFQTYCETLRIPILTIKRLVNHALPQDVTAGYIQFHMADLRRTVEIVAAYILRHAGRLPGKNVVSIDEKKRART